MKNENQPYQVLAYYHFSPIEDAKEEVRLHKEFLEKLDARGRIYISEEGINGQVSIHEKDAPTYIEWLQGKKEFQGMQIKVHTWEEHAFFKLKIKYREQIVALDTKVDMKETGIHLSPENWKKMMETSDDHIMIDVRNDYEWKVGHFEGAELPAYRTFREFKEYAQNLREETDSPEKPVMMYCTGGIRCELYSAYLKQLGFKKIYQLDGGVINYGLKMGSDHWLGKLFVFDDRMTVPISDDKHEVIGKCHACGAPTEDYYNCANMDCNDLFLACPECIKKEKGCCSSVCCEAPRVRPYAHQNPHKPFRKAYHYRQAAKSSSIS